MKIELKKLPEELERQAQLFCDLVGDANTGKLLVMAATEIRGLREVLAKTRGHVSDGQIDALVAKALAG